MTWKDIKLATLQKMVSAEGTTIPTDDATNDYIAAMPYACNEALQILSTSNSYLRTSAEITVEEAEEGYESYYDMSNEWGFHDFGTPEVYQTSENGIKTITDFTIRGSKIICFDEPGTYLVYYNAYPSKITENTLDTYVFPIADDAVVLIPLYMASQLYKDDNITIATIYRNEFDAARVELKRPNMGTKHYNSKWKTESGWV